MPLFGSRNDARLIDSITRELFNKYISNEVELYKLCLSDTETNLYGESSKKVYYNSVVLFSNITKDIGSFIDSDGGLDLTQPVKFPFLRTELLERNIVISEGDIIKFDERYYEVDSTFTAQYFMGRNNETHLITVQHRDREFGHNIAIVANTHLTRLSQLNLTNTYFGNQEISNSKTRE